MTSSERQWAKLLCILSLITSVQAQLPGESSFIVESAFPSSVFSTYYIKLAATSEPQPALYDPILNITYPLNLTDPTTIPTADDDPVFYREANADLTQADSEALVQNSLNQIHQIITGESASNCSKCIAALEVGKNLYWGLYVPIRHINFCLA